MTELPEVLIGMTDHEIRVGELSLPHSKGTESVLIPEELGTSGRSQGNANGGFLQNYSFIAFKKSC